MRQSLNRTIWCWANDIETLCASLAFGGNKLWPDPPHKRLVMGNIYVYFGISLNKLSNKQLCCRCFLQLDAHATSLKWDKQEFHRIPSLRFNYHRVRPFRILLWQPLLMRHSICNNTTELCFVNFIPSFQRLKVPRAQFMLWQNKMSTSFHAWFSEFPGVFCGAVKYVTHYIRWWNLIHSSNKKVNYVA